MTVNANCIPLNTLNASINPLTRHPENDIISGYFDGKTKKPDTPINGIIQIGIEFLDKTIEKLDQFIDAPRKFLRKLQHINKSRKKKKQSRINSIARVCKFLMKYLEIWTLKIGNFVGGNFVSLCDIQYIAKMTELSYISVRRALKDLILAGYLSVEKQVIKNESGEYIGIASIKQFSTSFFTDLNQKYQRLVKLREWKRKRVDKKLEQSLKKKGSSFLGGLVRTFSRKKHKNAFEGNNCSANRLIAKRKAYACEVIKMHNDFPSLTIQEIKERLAHMLE